MSYRHPTDFSPAEMRDKALASAIVLRDCSLRVQTSNPTRRVCRRLMREQAIKWRHPAGASSG